MELKYLNTVKTILETGSFQNAAHKLCYTQSTVTFQIQQLEQELSMKLFEKIGRKMVLTQAGKDILPYIDSILESVEQLTSYKKEIHALTGTLRVAMPETLLTYKMQPLLKTFRQQAPNIRLSLQALNCYMIRDQITNGGADVAVHYDVGGYGSTVVTEPLAKFSLSLVSSRALDKKQWDFTTAHQRIPLCLISYHKESISQIKFDQYLKDKDIVFENTIELGSIESIKRSVMSDLGIAFLPHFTVEEELKMGVLQELKTDMAREAVTALCAYHKNKWISPAMELFIRLTRESIAEKRECRQV